MELEQNNSNKNGSLVSQNKPNIENTPTDSFFSTSNLTNIFPIKTEEKVQEVNSLIDEIRKSSPISIWDLCKKVSISHSKLYYLIRDLEFAGVVYTKIKLNENNRSSRMIYISKEKKK